VRYFTLCFAILLVGTLSILQMQPVTGSSKSPYDSGYDHGCDDARISDPSDRYINQPEKGPSFHTNEFMSGYNAGYNACSGGLPPRGGGGSTPRSDLVQDFCSALKRGDLEDAEDLVGLLGGGSVSSLAKILCRLVQ
jgi:hypothetical protein